MAKKAWFERAKNVKELRGIVRGLQDQIVKIQAAHCRIRLDYDKVEQEKQELEKKLKNILVSEARVESDKEIGASVRVLAKAWLQEMMNVRRGSY
jgi:hypothetical protein